MKINNCYVRYHSQKIFKRLPQEVFDKKRSNLRYLHRGGNGINNILCKDVDIIVNSTCIFYKYSMMVMCKFQKQLQNTIGYYLKEDKFHEVRKKVMHWNNFIHCQKNSPIFLSK